MSRRALLTADEVIAWRTQANAQGHATSLDGVPKFVIRLVHLLWRA